MINTDIGRHVELDAMMDMLVVPEELVVMCSETMISIDGEDAENTFRNILEKGGVLKQNGRTPIYLCTADMKTMYVTSKEKINRDFH